ncbi:hypothetical protein [Phreatobacter sp.]|uniref:hypothetical protein n=1 Tax=Phreatobacter sp. TaxID=1966341 RepID=UPI0025F3BFBE|nr:hypothetical protein [Phreatobacter sp.]
MINTDQSGGRDFNVVKMRTHVLEDEGTNAKIEILEVLTMMAKSYHMLAQSIIDLDSNVDDRLDALLVIEKNIKDLSIIRDKVVRVCPGNRPPHAV